MAKNSKIELLKDVPLFARCSPKELAELAATADEIDIPEGRTLTREGLTGREFVVLAEGVADVESEGRVVNTLGPGDFFGEIALVTGAPRTATVRTRTPARLVVFTAPAFRSLLERAPRIRRRVVAAATLRLVR